MDDLSFGEFLLTMLVIYFLLAFLLILFAAIADIFSRGPLMAER